MSGRVTAESLCEALDDLGFESSDVEAKAVDRMLSLCDLYNIDADKITEEYLAFLTNRKIDFSSKGATPTIPLLDALDRECLSKLEAKRREDERRGITDVSSLHLNNAAAAAEEDEEQQSEMALAYGIKTPVHSGKRSTASSTPEVIFKKRGPFQSPSVTDNGLLPMTPNAAGKYAERTKKGETVITYNVEMQAIADWKTPDGDTNAVSVSQVASERPLDKPYRYALCLHNEAVPWLFFVLSLDSCLRVSERRPPALMRPFVGWAIIWPRRTRSKRSHMISSRRRSRSLSSLGESVATPPTGEG